MPPAPYNDELYVDGGLGGGIPLEIAQEDGFKKFFVVLSREKGYSKIPIRHPKILRGYYRKYPAMIEAMLNRYKVYNQTLEELRELESEGRAFLVYPDQMPVSSKEVDPKKLQESYDMGYIQGKRDAQKWREFLGV
jgi:predicted patatin/cPLA2 family phospholipase